MNTIANKIINTVIYTIGCSVFILCLFGYGINLERSFEYSRHKYIFVSVSSATETKIDTLKKLKFQGIDSTPFDVYDTGYLIVTLPLARNNNILIPQSVTITNLEGKLISKPFYHINDIDSGTQWVIKYPRGTLNNVVLGVTSYYIPTKPVVGRSEIIQDSILINIKQKTGYGIWGGS